MSNILKYADDRIDSLAMMDLSSLDVEIQTAGAKGLHFRRPKAGEMSWSFLGAIPVDPIADTAGSGDWCTAGLLYALSKTKTQVQYEHNSLVRSLKYGQMLAALNCMLPGARGLARSFEASFTHLQLAALLDEVSADAVQPKCWDTVRYEFQSRLRPQTVPVDRAEEDLSVRFCCHSLDH